MAEIAPNILIVESRFYSDIADRLATGAVAVLDEAGARYQRIEVPGALEIPPAIALADKHGAFDGYVALGCVIRGETDHYEIVAGVSANGLMNLSVQRTIAIGNGILTVDTRKQALARAAIDGGNKGAAAASACLDLIGARAALAEDPSP